MILAFQTPVRPPVVLVRLPPPAPPPAVGPSVIEVIVVGVTAAAAGVAAPGKGNNCFLKILKDICYTCVSWLRSGRFSYKNRIVFFFFRIKKEKISLELKRFLLFDICTGRVSGHFDLHFLMF